MLIRCFKILGDFFVDSKNSESESSARRKVHPFLSRESCYGVYIGFDLNLIHYFLINQFVFTTLSVYCLHVNLACVLF